MPLLNWLSPYYLPCYLTKTECVLETLGEFWNFIFLLRVQLSLYLKSVENEMPLAVVRDVIYSPIKSGFQKNDKRLRLKSPNTPEAKRRYLTPSGTRAGVFWWPLFYPLQWWAQVQLRTLLFREKVIANMNLFLLQRTNKFGKHHLHKVRDILNVKI